ncbi:MAG: type restriction enzyme subunit [Actinomycetota bacterium]|nr:type restriction enzyme subunit [Actinomycetota bacterium]
MSTVTTEIVSDVEWLPPLKPGWKLRPLWSMFERIKNVDHPDEQMLSVFRDYGVVAKDSRANLNQTAENRSIYQLVHPGWLVTNRMKAWQGSVGISALRGIVSGHYICFAPRHEEDSRYLNWLFRSAPYAHAYTLLSRGVRIGQVEIDNDDYRVLPVLLPPIDEQRAIADYLDRETARIDTLIEEQRRLIELLRERRQAVIESAASRGVDESVSMKSSGLSWAEKVPDHWVVANIRRFASMKTGHTPSRSNPDYWVDCTIPWFTLADVWQLRDGRRTYLDGTESKISELGLANSAADLLPAGTVVLSRTASVGFTGVMPEPMATSQDFWNWIPGEQLDSPYLMWVFRAMRKEFQALMIGSTHKTIYQPTAAAIRIPVPPLDEQRRIAAYLDEQTAKIDTLIAETETFIDLARERRSALITAAVTGQIDVRGAA